MTATNDVTGDKLVSKYSSKYYENYDTIFGKKEKVMQEPTEEFNVEDNERNNHAKT